MLFMVIETLHDVDAVGARFREKGRMLTEGVTYVASWGELDGGRWFQLMEAPDEASLISWTKRWDDLAAFEIHPVVASKDFWSTRKLK